MASSNFLIGRGELLTQDVPYPGGGGSKAPVYTFQEAADRLLPELAHASERLALLPEEACPGDFAVIRVAMNPAYIAKSYFPEALLRSIGCESVGSRTISIKPLKWTKQGPPEASTTTELFVAGRRAELAVLPEAVRTLDPELIEAEEFARFERINAYLAADRLKRGLEEGSGVYEVGLHTLAQDKTGFVEDGLRRYASSCGVEIVEDLSFSVGGLRFFAVRAEESGIEKLAEFTMVRVARPMPRLRGLQPFIRSSSVALSCSLPDLPAIASDTRVAVLDGGLPEKHSMGRWVSSYIELDPNAKPIPAGLKHGLGVTSALLFGPIRPGEQAATPLCSVDHLRVLDEGIADENPLELYRTLGLIEQVLLSRKYEFINLSLGPRLPIEDDDVHAWTAVLDDHLSDGATLLTVAVGNDGEKDVKSGNARIQVPSDSVNAVAVGAATTDGPDWKRAPYSSIGPGRSPGVIKPDLLTFGGSPDQYFHHLDEGASPQLVPNLGTSYASPLALRTAVGMRTILGPDLSPLALKALLVHSARPEGKSPIEVGWGRIPSDPLEPILSPDGVARVLYQGELKPGKYLRAHIPVPSGGLRGIITLRATLCYACPVDPQDAASYTRAGLEVTFRPNKNRLREGSKNRKTRSFFELGKYSTESERRSDHGKWETTLSSETRLQGRLLDEPVFDIHYNARAGGHGARDADRIRYALVVTVEAKQHPQLHNEILQAYQSILVPLRPRIAVPLRL